MILTTARKVTLKGSTRMEIQKKEEPDLSEELGTDPKFNKLRSIGSTPHAGSRPKYSADSQVRRLFRTPILVSM